jgi:hypothetical protein
VTKRLPPDLVQALAVLWCESYGPAADLVGFLKKNPDDPRSVDVPKIEPLLQRFLVRWSEHDVNGATVISAQINRAMFNCNARELGPLVKAGRKNKREFFAGRAEANRVRRDTRAEVWSEWQKEADEFWSRKPTATKSQVAHHIVNKAGLDRRQHKTVTRRIRKVGQAS